MVPILIVIILLANMDFGNFSIAGADPGGIHGIFSAVVGAGIAFSFLGFRQAVDFAAEAKNPQKDVAKAITLFILLCLVLYILLQVAFIGAITPDLLNGGWAHVNMSSPWAKLAETLGIVWLANIVLLDSAISPAATGNIFLSGTARMMFAYSKNGLFYSVFAKVDKRTGLPRGALWLAMIMGILWTLPAQFQTWSGLVDAVTGAFVLTYMTGSISASALRKRAPEMKRPFKLKGMGWISPLAFIAASEVALWSGWDSMKLLIPIIAGSLVLYFAFVDKDKTIRTNLYEDFLACLWLFGFYAFILLMTYIGSFGPKHWIAGPWDSIIVAAGSIAIFYWGVHTSLKKPRITEDAELALDTEKPFA